MVNKKSFRKRNIFYFIIISIFVLLLVYVRLDRVYEDSKMEAYNFFPNSHSDGGVTIKNADINLDVENSAPIIISVQPGETHEGQIMVKSYERAESDFVFNFFGDIAYSRQEEVVMNAIKEAEENEELEEKNEDSTEELIEENDEIEEELVETEVAPEDFEFDQEAFEEGKVVVNLETEKAGRIKLEPYEWRLIDYSLEISEDMELGDYKGTLGVRKDQLYKNSAGTKLAFVVGVEIYIEVTDEPKDYNYQSGIENVDFHQYAMDEVTKEAKKVLGVAFVLLAFYFLYRAALEKKKS